MTSKRERTPQATPRIIIIGGGFGGIALGVKLRQAGIRDFTILEADAGPGGTWWSNDYPGAEVDVHSAIYSYSFKSHNWTRTHAGQPELLEYIKDVVREFGLEPHFRYSTRVTDVRWDEAAQLHHVRTADGVEIDAHIVVSAVGMLSDPKYPDWPGLDLFQGRVLHSSHWDHDLDLKGKTVGIVGVGSTSVQIIPTIAPDVQNLYVFQREPGWVLPKGARDFTSAEKAIYAHPLQRAWRRLKLFARSEWLHTWSPVYVARSKRSERAKQISLAYIDRVFADRPDLKDAVTPRYTFSGKRRVLSDDYYPTLLRDNVELVTGGVERMTETAVVTADGREVPVDVLITATGFKASEYLSSLNVSGRSGLVLSEVWNDGAFAFLGVAVPGFPNFYMMYGPNTNGGAPITAMLERQAEFIVADVRRMIRHGFASIEVKSVASARYQKWIQGRMRGTAWLEGNNYFKGPKGQIVTQWRDGSVVYSLLLKSLRVLSSKGRRVVPWMPLGSAAGASTPDMRSENDESITGGAG